MRMLLPQPGLEESGLLSKPTEATPLLDEAQGFSGTLGERNGLGDARSHAVASLRGGGDDLGDEATAMDLAVESDAEAESDTREESDAGVESDEEEAFGDSPAEGAQTSSAQASAAKRPRTEQATPRSVKPATSAKSKSPKRNSTAETAARSASKTAAHSAKNVRRAST